MASEIHPPCLVSCHLLPTSQAVIELISFIGCPFGNMLLKVSKASSNAWFVGLNPFAAVILMMSLDFAKKTHLIWVLHCPLELPWFELLEHEPLLH
jgi:hypothetical protein